MRNDCRSCRSYPFISTTNLQLHLDEVLACNVRLRTIYYLTYVCPISTARLNHHVIEDKVLGLVVE